MAPVRISFLVGVAALAPSSSCSRRSASAQSAQRYSVQASGIFVGTFGEAYDGLKSGPGFEAQFRITPSAWSYGFGIQGSIALVRRRYPGK